VCVGIIEDLIVEIYKDQNSNNNRTQFGKFFRTFDEAVAWRREKEIEFGYIVIEYLFIELYLIMYNFFIYCT